MARNPFFSPASPELNDSVREQLRRIVIGFLQANSDQPVIADAVVQALHPLLAIPRVYAAIKAELGL